MPQYKLYLSFIAKTNLEHGWTSAQEVRITDTCPPDRSEELEDAHNNTGIFQTWEYNKITLAPPEDQQEKPSTVHVVFNYHDNQCDCAVAFANLEQAQKHFEEQEREMLEEDLPEWERCNRPKYSFAVFKKNKWHCEILVFDESRRSWDRPDEGSAWWWMSLPIDWNAHNLSFDENVVSLLRC